MSKRKPVAIMPKSAFPLVLIEWVDSMGCGGAWNRLGDLDDKPAVIRSVGWLVKDLPDLKVIVPHLLEYAEESQPRSQVQGDMSIPTVAIVRTKRLGR